MTKFARDYSENGIQMSFKHFLFYILAASLPVSCANNHPASPEEDIVAWMQENSADDSLIPTSTHLLALCIISGSGLPDMPDRLVSASEKCREAEELLSALPDTWDETKLLSEDSGDHIIVARRKADKWHVAGINCTDEFVTLNIHLKKLGRTAPVANTFIDGGYGDSIIPASGAPLPSRINLLPRGGFVAVLRAR